MMVDVVIVGGGPTGLMLAAELCLGGVTPIVLDRRVSPDPTPKANGLAGHVVRLMDQRGLYEPLAALASAPSRSARLLFRVLAGHRPVPAPRFPFGGFTLDLRRLADNPMSVL